MAALAATLLLAAGLAAQAPEAKPAEEAPETTAVAVIFPPGQRVRVALAGTPRLSTASGEARVERQRGITTLRIQLKGLRRAEAFGGDFNTFVAWAIAPEGRVENLGELLLKNADATLDTATLLQTFGLVITAEPHFLVTRPSTVVVASADAGARSLTGQFQVRPAAYRPTATRYEIEREAIGDEPEVKGEVIVNPRQAETAIAIAERGIAAQYSQTELSRARESFRLLMEELRKPQSNPAALTMHLHDAVRWTVLAEELSVGRSLEAERQARQKAFETEFRRAEVAEENLRNTTARLKETEAGLEKTKQALAKTTADLQLAYKEKEEALTLMERTDRARDELEAATLKLREAQHDYRTRFREALARVVEVNETERGIVVSLGDILFDSGKASLRGNAREILSRLTGILLVAAEFGLKIEGHTDATGRADRNLKLSLERATAVADYLVESGIAPEAIAIEGFGDSRPIDSNRTAQGRARNRRVEIIITNLVH